MSLPNNILKCSGACGKTWVFSVFMTTVRTSTNTSHAQLPVLASPTTLLMDGKDPGGGEKEGKVRSSRDEEEQHPPCSFLHEMV